MDNNLLEENGDFVDDGKKKWKEKEERREKKGGNRCLRIREKWKVKVLR